MSGPPAPPRDRSDPWRGVLPAEETILWQGRPSGRLRITRHHLPTLLFGAAYAGFAVVWMTVAFRAAAGIGPVGYVFPLFGLPFVAIGLWMMIGLPLWDAILRQHSFYTLTNQRGFIGSDLPRLGRHLHSQKLDLDALEITQTDGLTDVRFAKRDMRAGRWINKLALDRNRLAGRPRPAVFAALEDPAPLLDALSQLQSERPPA